MISGFVLFLFVNLMIILQKDLLIFQERAGPRRTRAGGERGEREEEREKLGVER